MCEIYFEKYWCSDDDDLSNDLFPQVPAIDDNEWHTLQLSVEEQVVRLWLDGRLIASGLDDYSTTGTVGLTTRKQVVEWRNISVWEAPW